MQLELELDPLSHEWYMLEAMRHSDDSRILWQLHTILHLQIKE